jgi:hypothetical protein
MIRIKKEGFLDYQTIEFGFKPQGISPEYLASGHSVLPRVRQLVSLDRGSGDTKGGREEA